MVSRGSVVMWEVGRWGTAARVPQAGTPHPAPPCLASMHAHPLHFLPPSHHIIPLPQPALLQPGPSASHHRSPLLRPGGAEHDR